MEEMFFGKKKQEGPSVPPPPSADDAEKKDYVLRELSKLYTKVFRPIEEATKFDVFYSSLLNEAEFRTPPMVLLVGPYSVGKTTFIEYLLGRKFPGQRIGPEPTTDRFTAVMYGEDDRTIPGNALTVAPNSPFRALQREGNAFLSRFEGSLCAAPLLEHLSLIDTPGVLSGEKQRVQRHYDFDVVVQWFAERVDLIVLLFDPFKLDISDELTGVIRRFRGHEDKFASMASMRLSVIVMLSTRLTVSTNAGDRVNQQQLMRVYGALMWSLGRVLDTPEVCRVYVGSFHDEELRDPDTAELGVLYLKGEKAVGGLFSDFEAVRTATVPSAQAPLLAAEMGDLLSDLRELPQQSATRRVNELVKRARLLKAHCYLLDHLREQMPSVYGFQKKKQELLNSMPAQFRTVCRARGLSPGDFPDLQKFVAVAKEVDFAQFPRVNGSRMKKGKMMQELEAALNNAIPALMEFLPRGAASVEEPATESVGVSEVETVI